MKQIQIRTTGTKYSLKWHDMKYFSYKNSKVSENARDTEQPGEVKLPILPPLTGVYIFHFALNHEFWGIREKMWSKGPPPQKKRGWKREGLMGGGKWKKKGKEEILAGGGGKNIDIQINIHPSFLELNPYKYRPDPELILERDKKKEGCTNQQRNLLEGNKNILDHSPWPLIRFFGRYTHHGFEQNETISIMIGSSTPNLKLGLK